MSVITHRDTEATASDLTFARGSTNRPLWQRALALFKRAYGPLIIYAVLAVALVAALAIRVAAFVPQVWH